MRVIVTRPAAQAAEFVQRSRELGVEAVPLPLIGIEPASDIQALRRAWAQLPGASLVMFVSANAVEQFFALRPDGAVWPQGVPAGVTGPGSAAALRAAGVADAAIVQPAAGGPYDSEALWSRLEGRPWAGRQVLIVRGEGGRDWLAEQLRAAGAEVRFVTAYRRVAPVVDAGLLRSALADPAGHCWHFSSSESIDHLEQACAGADWGASRALATHPRIAERARRAGFGKVEQIDPGAEALAAALADPAVKPRR